MTLRIVTTCVSFTQPESLPVKSLVVCQYLYNHKFLVVIYQLLTNLMFGNAKNTARLYIPTWQGAILCHFSLALQLMLSYYRNHSQVRVLHLAIQQDMGGISLLFQREEKIRDCLEYQRSFLFYMHHHYR